MTTLQPESDATRDLRRLCDKFGVSFEAARLTMNPDATPEANAVEAHRHALSAKFGVEVSTEGAADSLALSKELEATHGHK